MPHIINTRQFFHKLNPAFEVEETIVKVKEGSAESLEIDTLNKNFEIAMKQLEDIHLTLMSDLMINMMTYKLTQREETLLVKQNETLKTVCEMLRKEMIK